MLHASRGTLVAGTRHSLHGQSCLACARGHASLAGSPLRSKRECRGPSGAIVRVGNKRHVVVHFCGESIGEILTSTCCLYHPYTVLHEFVR
jgi:hypothetical protein